MNRLASSTAIGAIAGFCTRPCCLIPALMSLTGVGSAAVAQTVAAYRWVFLTAGGLLLAAALWATLRREGGWFNKALAIGATAAGFAVSLRVLEIL